MKYFSVTRSCVNPVRFHVPLIQPSAFPPNDIISSHRLVARPTLPVVQHKAHTEGVNGVHMYRMLLEGGSTLIGPAFSLHPTPPQPCKVVSGLHVTVSLERNTKWRALWGEISSGGGLIREKPNKRKLKTLQAARHSLNTGEMWCRKCVLHIRHNNYTAYSLSENSSD